MTMSSKVHVSDVMAMLSHQTSCRNGNQGINNRHRLLRSLLLLLLAVLVLVAVVYPALDGSVQLDGLSGWLQLLQQQQQQHQHQQDGTTIQIQILRSATTAIRTTIAAAAAAELQVVNNGRQLSLVVVVVVVDLYRSVVIYLVGVDGVVTLVGVDEATR